MKAVMVMFDSLNRHMLPPYGALATIAPNFERLARRCAVFDNCYVGSMPCMPARRELHTGRYNFLHRDWGPVEPFDDSMPEILKQNGVYTHLCTDHYHYFEDGGATYHMRYSSHENFRGQEADKWKADLTPDFHVPENLNLRDTLVRQDFINRTYTADENTHSEIRTFNAGLEFLEKNHGADRWFLQIETFDPHEPWYSLQQYRNLYPHDYDGPLFDWTEYGRPESSTQYREHLRCEYLALVSMCDRQLGRVLDFMDDHDMWSNTMLIVNTDHGFMIGEQGFWGKCVMPFYNEVAHTPLFIWDPRSPEAAGQRRQALVQTIDLAPTLLEFFGLAPTPEMQGVPLRDTVACDSPVREAGLFGIHGGQVCITDGRFVYMRGPVRPDNTPLFAYTLLPLCHGRERACYKEDALRQAELAGPFAFTKGMRVLKVPYGCKTPNYTFPTALYDLKTDPRQLKPVTDEAEELRMCGLMRELMQKNDCPPEQFERLGLQ